MKTDNQKLYAIYYLSDTGLTPAKISKELSLSTKEVKDILSERNPPKKDTIRTTSSPVNSKNLMITETSVKGNKTVAIMTKEASEVNDEFKKKIPSTQSRTAKNAIFRPIKNK